MACGVKWKTGRELVSITRGYIYTEYEYINYDVHEDKDWLCQGTVEVYRIPTKLGKFLGYQEYYSKINLRN